MTASLGERIVVTGMAGSGKSTLSCKLAEQTDLPLIHLDLYLWQPGWRRVPRAEFIETQRRLLAADRWVVDSNDVTDELVIQRADTLVVLTTPWWLCSMRALRRGLRRPAGVKLPAGCPESFIQRIRDEWGIAWRNLANRRSIRDHGRALARLCRAKEIAVFELASKEDQRRFVSAEHG